GVASRTRLFPLDNGLLFLANSLLLLPIGVDQRPERNHQRHKDRNSGHARVPDLPAAALLFVPPLGFALALLGAPFSKAFIEKSHRFLEAGMVPLRPFLIRSTLLSPLQ